jgi:uncharacterized membrane protein
VLLSGRIFVLGCIFSSVKQVDTEDGTGSDVVRGSPGAFVFHSYPRCALTRTQQRWFFSSLVLLCFGIATVFAVLGYWLVLPFAGLEIGLLAWALDTMRSRERDFETLMIDGDVVLLEWRTGRQGGRRELNRQWVRVECNCAASGRNCQLAVSSHGSETEIGHYLGDAARIKLALTLRNRLAQGGNRQ